MKSLPPRPSLASLRKQARKLARDRSLALRDAQLALARDYGFAGWQHLVAEVSKRNGQGLEWAAVQARRVIHDNDVERLTRLLAEYPALLHWRGDPEGKGLMGMATGAYGDAGTEERERWYTRAACAEVLLDAGAVVSPPVLTGLLESRARGLLRLFERRALLPRTLEFRAALGDVAGVRALLPAAADVASVNAAFVRACSFGHEDVAALVLDRLVALDPSLGRRVDEHIGRSALVRYFIEKGAGDALTAGPWKAFVMQRVSHAIGDKDLDAFVAELTRESWLLGDDSLAFQNRIISDMALNGQLAFLTALFDRRPAILRSSPPPPTQAIEHALTYGHPEAIPLLTRIWPVPDDLPHAAGLGNLAAVKRWFDASGAPALGDPLAHAPHTSIHQEAFDDWGAPPQQKVLDTALAWAVINHHFDVADYLLQHGADINTRWNSHEPASILHTLVFEDDYEAMQFLIDRGIDMTIRDHRWDSDAHGWALYGKGDPAMAEWLTAAARKRGSATSLPSPGP